MHHKCTARHLKRARLARGSLDSADSAISFVCEERYPVTIAVGKHLFPSRTQQLSPPAPMVLPWQRGGRVGRCRVSLFSVFADNPLSFGLQDRAGFECRNDPTKACGAGVLAIAWPR